MQKKIAITGGIGSGKSLAAKYVAELGYPVFSCDEINKELMHDPEYIGKIKNVFYSCVKENRIDKNALKDLVFSDEAALKRLNEVAHPIIMKRLLSAMEDSEGALVFAEVPLLFEGGYENFFDEIIVITRDTDKRIEALKVRDGFSEEEIKNRIAAQFDYSRLQERIQNLPAHVIKNEGDVLSLKNKLHNLIAQLL